MADPYDGSTFVALDDDCASNTGGAGRPLSAFVDQALWSNWLHLERQGSSASWSPAHSAGGDYTNFKGHRPICSSRFTTFFRAPLIAQRNLREVEVQLVYRVGDLLGDARSVTVRATLGDVRGDKPVIYAQTTATLANTEALDPEWRTERLRLVVGQIPLFPSNPLPMQAERLTTLSLEAISEYARSDDRFSLTLIGETIDPITGGLVTSPRGGYGDGDFLEPAAGGSPDHGSSGSTSQETAATLLEDDDSLLDHLLSDGSGEMLVHPALTGGARNASRDQLPYLQIRSVGVSTHFADERGQVQQGRFLAQRSVNTGDVIHHPLGIERGYERKRLAAIGPRATVDPESSRWPAGLCPRWPKVFGDGESPVPVQRQAIELRTVDPVVRCFLDVLPVWEGAAASFDDLGALREALTVAQWTFEARVEGYVSGATRTALGSATAEIGVGHYPLDVSGRSATLGALARHTVVLNPPVVPVGPRRYGVPDPYWYKEGQLYPGDLPLLQRIEFSVLVTGFDPETAGPLVFALDATAPDEFPDAGIAGTTDVLTLAMYVVGATYWEVPQ